FDSSNSCESLRWRSLSLQTPHHRAEFSGFRVVSQFEFRVQIQQGFQRQTETLPRPPFPCIRLYTQLRSRVVKGRGDECMEADLLDTSVEALTTECRQAAKHRRGLTRCRWQRQNRGGTDHAERRKQRTLDWSRTRHPHGHAHAALLAAGLRCRRSAQESLP